MHIAALNERHVLCHTIVHSTLLHKPKNRIKRGFEDSASAIPLTEYRSGGVGLGLAVKQLCLMGNP